MTRAEVERALQDLLRRWFELRERPPFRAGETAVPLMEPSFGWPEVWEALESMLSGRVTMGAKVARFESKFAEYVGQRYALMVNSGSSANLIALSLLAQPEAPGRLRPGAEIITPAVTWATTVAPIVQSGFVPVLVDVEMDTFNLTAERVEQAITPRTGAVVPVHLLGNPCPMPEIMELARRHDLLVIEDCCEAHGAAVDGRRVGSFGELATFSFYFAHHITTIEGGMLLTDDEDRYSLAASLRTFGWVRGLPRERELAARYPDIDPRYLFLNLGYNFRPTELQGAFGIHQLPRLEQIIEQRRENARCWGRALADLGDRLLLHEERPGTRHVWYGYPITVRPGAGFSRDELVAFLEERGVETRPIMAGNFQEQPCLRPYRHRVAGSLENARLIMRNSFFIGNHGGIGPEQRDAVAGYIHEFVERAAVGQAGLTAGRR